MRKSRFKIKAPPGETFDASVDEATVTIEWANESTCVFVVRPKHSRKEYRRTLQQVARAVIQHGSLS